MIDELDLIADLSARVGALEMVIKTLVAFQLSSQAKDAAGYAKAAQAARELSKNLQTVFALKAAAALAADPGSLDPTMLKVMKDTIARCFEQPADQMEETAKLVLAAMATASDTTQ